MICSIVNKLLIFVDDLKNLSGPCPHLTILTVYKHSLINREHGKKQQVKRLIHNKKRKQKSRCSRLTYRIMQRSQKRQQAIEKASAFITNISNYALTEDQIIALSKGLGSIPTPDKPSRFSLIRYNNNLIRTMKIKILCHRKAKVHSNTSGLQDQITNSFSPGIYIGHALLKHWNIIDKNVRLK